MTSIPRPPRPCLDCYQPTTNRGQRCDQHTRTRTKQRNASATHQAYHTPEYRRARRLCIQRSYNTCALCVSVENLTAHHINHDNTDNHQANLVCLCLPCHMGIEHEYQRGINGQYHDQLSEHLRAITPPPHTSGATP